jgi:hypothetical protein
LISFNEKTKKRKNDGGPLAGPHGPLRARAKFCPGIAVRLISRACARDRITVGEALPDLQLGVRAGVWSNLDVKSQESRVDPPRADAKIRQLIRLRIVDETLNFDVKQMQR